VPKRHGKQQGIAASDATKYHNTGETFPVDRKVQLLRELRGRGGRQIPSSILGETAKRAAVNRNCDSHYCDMTHLSDWSERKRQLVYSEPMNSSEHIRARIQLRDKSARALHMLKLHLSTEIQNPKRWQQNEKYKISVSFIIVFQFQLQSASSTNKRILKHNAESRQIQIMS
jgi:hypothetical protein